MDHKLRGTEEEYPREVFPDRPTIGSYSPAKTGDFLTGGNRPSLDKPVAHFMTL